jgi:hypothetical protein
VRTVIHRVTSTDAHNWVEAYFPHYGWIPFEPTPPSEVAGNYETFPRGTAANQPGDSATTGPEPTPLPAPRPVSTPQVAPGAVPPDTRGAPRGLEVLVVGTLVLLLLALGTWRWLSGARTGGGLRQRMRVMGLAFGVRRRPSDTDAGFVRRLVLALPPDTTTLLHRDGSAPPGPRPLRATAAEALVAVAALSGKERFSREGLIPAEQVRRRRAWQRFCRVSLLLLWRRLLAATARG